MSDKDSFDEIALAQCGPLLAMRACQSLPREVREGIVLIAFSYGAAWALNAPDMIQLLNAMAERHQSVLS